jgi:hypothetical protein
MVPMSHLSILPTVLRDADLLEACLGSMGLSPQRDVQLQGFGGEQRAVVVMLQLDADIALGWCRCNDGSLALVGDLQRLSRSRSLEPLLVRITREYAARDALRQARSHLSDALVCVGD